MKRKISNLYEIPIYQLKISGKNGIILTKEYDSYTMKDVLIKLFSCNQLFFISQINNDKIPFDQLSHPKYILSENIGNLSLLFKLLSFDFESLFLN